MSHQKNFKIQSQQPFDQLFEDDFMKSETSIKKSQYTIDVKRQISEYQHMSAQIYKNNRT